MGMFLYNDVLIMPFMRKLGWVHDDIPAEPLLNEDPEHLEASGRRVAL